MNYLKPLFFLTILVIRAVGQDAGFTSVPGCPCPEVYDLMKDSRGYIWMAHDFGISRYDGRNFVSFSNPRQNAIAVTDLAEDPKGRIWCHNFAGQIFYIEDFRLHLLDAYNPENEAIYPRIGICGDELVATSAEGLFTLNTKTFVSHYYHFAGGSSTLTVLRNKVLLYGDGAWHLYRPGSGVISIDGSAVSFDKTGNVALQPKGLEDTAYFIQNPEGSYYRLFVHDNRLCLAEKRTLGSFINAVTIDSGDVWVHMRAFSWCERTGEKLGDMNMTDLIRDAYGNVFVSSLKGGLLVRYRSSYAESMDPLYPDKKDVIRKMVAVGDTVVCGTQDGRLLLMDRNFIRRLGELAAPGKDIPIEILFPLSRDECIVGTTIGTFSLNFRKNRLRLIDKNLILKDLVCVDGTLYLATNRDLKSIPVDRLIHFTGQQLHSSDYTVIRQGRTRAIGKRIVGNRTTVLCSFNDGVYEISGASQRHLLYKGQPIYATAMGEFRNKTVIGTFSEGVLILEGNRITQLSARNGLLSNSIRGIRMAPDGIWLLSFSGALQKLDSNFRFMANHVATFRSGVIYDVLQRDSEIFVAANTRFYRTVAVPRMAVSGCTAVDYILVNGKDSAVGKSVFPHDENNLQINLSTPFFHPYDFLRYKYRVLDRKASDANWQIGGDDQKSFSLAALPPGEYFFEASAIDPIGEEIAPPVRQRIDIRPAWYQTRLFMIGAVVLAAVLIFYAVRLFFLSRLREQRARLERELAVARERQRISADLHDDIGSTLSSINIYTGLAKKGENSDWYFSVISQNVNTVIEKLDDLVWSINPKYDSIGDIAKRLLAYGEPVAKMKEIAIRIVVDPGAGNARPRQDVKNHLYLIVKELINNAMKHSGCGAIAICFGCAGKKIVVTVSDDGSGISPADLEKGRNGIGNIRMRVAELGGALEIQSPGTGGTCAVIEIPV